MIINGVLLLQCLLLALLVGYCAVDAMAVAMDRRTAVMGGVCAAGATLCEPSMARAQDETLTKINELLGKLQGIPSFCIVDSGNGAAYMVLRNKQAVGYAFTTFSGALAVLGDAQRNAEKKNIVDIWKEATITIVPMDISMRLALKDRVRTSPKDVQLDSILEVIPGAEDRNAGVQFDSKFKEQSKVPLFYLDRPSKSGTTALFFSKYDLVVTWNQQHPGEDLPKIKVLELNALFENILRNKGNPDNIIFVANQESLKAAEELKSRGKLAPYNPDRMVV